MDIIKYMYNVNYQEYDESLCAIEKRALFKAELSDKVFTSSIKIDPSVSPYIKQRLDILLDEDSLEALIEGLKRLSVIGSETKVKYIKLKSGDKHAANRKQLINRIRTEVGVELEKVVYQNLYGVTNYANRWYFGQLNKNSGQWRDHNNRPHTYSNSLKINMAKVLINIAGNGDMSKKLIDPCCGAGTVLLEGCFAGYEMTGSDINEKMTKAAKNNLSHFGYEATLRCQAIESISSEYDAAIIDLPYGLYSQTTSELQKSIIANAKRIAKKIIIVSSEDISLMLSEIGLEVVDSCNYIKSINRKFTRYIWVCE